MYTVVVGMGRPMFDTPASISSSPISLKVTWTVVSVMPNMLMSFVSGRNVRHFRSSDPGERFPTEDHVAHRERWPRARRLIHQRLECRRHLTEHRGARAFQQGEKIGGALRHDARHHHGTAAVHEGAEHLPHRKIERERVEHGPHIALAEVELEVIVHQQPRDVAVLDHASLGTTGGSGRIDHVRHVPWRHVCIRPRGAASLPHRIGHVHGRGGHAKLGEPRAIVGVGEHEARAGIGDGERDALIRIRRIDRQVGASRLEDAKDGNDRVHRSFEEIYADALVCR